jgi:hypothetical protein
MSLTLRRAHVALRRQAERVLLVGNLVTLPLLGRECLCEVVGPDPSPPR